MSNKYPIKIGATFSVALQRVSGGNPVPLTGVEVTSFLKHPKFGKYELDVMIVDEAEGRVRLVLDADTTARMTPGDYLWDVTYTDPDGEVEVFPKDNKQVILQFIKGASL